MKTFTVLLILLFCGMIAAQSQTYDDFEGKKLIYYGTKSPGLDSAAKNPSPNKINNSGKCAKYVRSKDKKFDNVKMALPGRLSDVSTYATYLGIPPKLKMKVYTTAPAGTLVEILLGNKNRNNEYPAGTNSQYQAYTTVSGQWEELEFKFSQIPDGSQTATTEVDQVTLLFNPNSSTADTYYFDDLTGPEVIQVKTEATKDTQVKEAEAKKEENKDSKKTTGEKNTVKKQ